MTAAFSVAFVVYVYIAAGLLRKGIADRSRPFGIGVVALIAISWPILGVYFILESAIRRILELAERALLKRPPPPPPPS